MITAVHIELGADQIDIGSESRIKTAAIPGGTFLNDHVRQIQCGTCSAEMDHTAMTIADITAGKGHAFHRYRKTGTGNGEHTVCGGRITERFEVAHTRCLHRDLNDFARIVSDMEGRTDIQRGIQRDHIGICAEYRGIKGDHAGI